MHISQNRFTQEIVPTNMPYTSSLLNQNLKTLQTTYPFLRQTIIGQSVMKKSIHCIQFGEGPRTVFYSASFHANEWITSVLLMKFLENLCKATVANGSIYGYPAQQIFKEATIYIAPMINPDGVDLVTGAYSPNSEIYKSFKQIANSYPSIPFPSGWKANRNGVDLNLQFPAGWENAKRIKYSQGIHTPAPRDFVGSQALSEPEALALYNFTLSHNFHLIIAYHTQGKEIYWNFQNINPPRGYEIGRRFADASKYILSQVPYDSSFAGYKDWFIQEFNKPGYTIEAGIGENPLFLSQFNEIYQDNLGILVLGAML